MKEPENAQSIVAERPTASGKYRSLVPPTAEEAARIERLLESGSYIKELTERGLTIGLVRINGEKVLGEVPVRSELPDELRRLISRRDCG